MRRSKHNLSHYHLTTFDMGELIPIGCVEVLPGDTFRHASSAMLRIAPLAKPLMHPVRVQIHHWYVPNRLVWSGWEDFITGKVEEATTPLPTITLSATAANNRLADYLGVDPASGTIDINALPVRAYNMIWNEFYRDQDLSTAVSEDDLNILRAAWEKDYFTTARTAAQEGSEVNIPFGSGSKATVKTDGITGASIPVYSTSNADYTRQDVSGSTVVVTATSDAAADALYADLGGATTTMSISDWRNAVALQRFAEARNRFGERYVDYLRYLGVNPSDGRLDRPEYLGGGKQTVAFSEVLATSDDGTSHNVGDLFGHGIAAMRTRPYRRFFEEHGHVISLATVRPKAIYTEAMSRNFLRAAKEDYWQKEQEILGMQPVTKREVYSSHANATDVFGYVDRYMEYRFECSRVSSAFRDTTDYDWHLGRILGTSPSLNQSFIECTPSDRVYQDTSMPEVYMMANNQIAAQRLVAKRARIS